jgi:hypothetical protein
MCQCHDMYEPVPYRPAVPLPQVVTQCHDPYPGQDVDRPETKEKLEVVAFAGREPARV